MSVTASKVGVVLCRALSEKSKDSIGKISYYLNKIVNCYQTRCRRQYYLCLLATQRMHAPVHGAPNTVQQLMRKLSTPFLLSYGPNRPELNSIDYKI